MPPAVPPQDASSPQRRRLLGALGTALLGGCAGAPRARPPSAHEIPPFSGVQPQADGLPPGWHAHVMRRDLPPTRYELTQYQGRAAVHALAQGSISGLRCDVDLDPQRTPWLSWSWRIEGLGGQPTVADDDRDDAPARIVLAFDGDLGSLNPRDLLFHEQVELFTGHRLPFATLMYTWDGEAAPESVLQYPRSSRIRYLVVEQGARHAGQWLEMRRNVLEDYRRVFGGTPGRITQVGLLTDSDDLRNRAEAWFGDLRLEAGP